MKLIDELKEIQETINKLHKERMDLLRSSIQSVIDHLFAIHPKLEWFKWQQYTQYFNDGEPCDFHVYTSRLGKG